MPDGEPFLYDLREYERMELDRGVLGSLSNSGVQWDGFVREPDWTSRLRREASRKVVACASWAFGAKSASGTVEGGFCEKP